MRPGVWRICCDAPRERGEPRQQCYRTLHGTRREAEREAARFWAEVQEQGAPRRPNPKTVREYLDEWLSTAIAPHKRPGTARTYRGAAARLCVHLGEIQLARLRALDIERAYAAMAADYAPGTIRADHHILSGALSRAVRWGLIEVSPMRDVTPPPEEREPRGKALTVEQAITFLDAIQGHRQRVRLVLGLGLGLRAGEAMGLQWGDLDLNALLQARPCVATIERQWVREFHTYGPLKSGSARKVGVPEFTAAILREEFARQAAIREKDPGWNPDNLVAVCRFGRPVAHNLAGVVRDVCKAAGLPPIRFHDLRHTIASLRAEAGENPAQVADELGHDREMYIRTYVHVSAGAVIVGAERVNGILGG
jgi:integrase